MFEKGRKKTGGKKKGVKNKSTLIFEDLLKNSKYELLETAIKMAKEGNASIMNKLLDKFLPSLNAVDFTSKENLMPTININVRSNSITT